MTGLVDVLNCNHGHLTVSFDGSDPLETERAKRIVQDMLRRGYALFIEDDKKKLHKVKKFDAERCHYIIADGPIYAGETIEPKEPTLTPRQSSPNAKCQTGKDRRVHAGKARATGIAPTAGG